MTATTASDAAHISPGEFTQIDFSRVDTRLHPIQAWRAFRRLMASPGDTRQVFAIFRALRGGSGLKAFRRFAASAEERTPEQHDGRGGTPAGGRSLAGQG